MYVGAGGISGYSYSNTKCARRISIYSFIC
jgi:hypothetical protein